MPTPAGAAPRLGSRWRHPGPARTAAGCGSGRLGAAPRMRRRRWSAAARRGRLWLARWRSGWSARPVAARRRPRCGGRCAVQDADRGGVCQGPRHPKLHAAGIGSAIRPRSLAWEVARIAARRGRPRRRPQRRPRVCPEPLRTCRGSSRRALLEERCRGLGCVSGQTDATRQGAVSCATAAGKERARPSPPRSPSRCAKVTGSRELDPRPAALAFSRYSAHSP